MIDLTVVIPSCGRRSLPAAIESARRQRGLDVEVVVVDASGRSAVADLVAGVEAMSFTCLDPGVPLSAGQARATGCASAQAEWVALLDDDDVFLPDKCGRQIAEAERDDASIVTTNFVGVPFERLSDLLWAASDWDRVLAALAERGRRGPRQKPSNTESMSAYLFERHSLRSRKRLVTSSILVRSRVALDAPWHTSLRRFEDWDWLMAVQDSGAKWAHVDESLVVIGEGAPNSLTAADSPLGPAHLHWPIGPLEANYPRALGDVLACDIGVTLAKRGDVAGAIQALRLARIVGDPGWPAMTRWAAAVVAAQARRGINRSLSLSAASS